MQHYFFLFFAHIVAGGEKLKIAAQMFDGVLLFAREMLDEVRPRNAIVAAEAKAGDQTLRRRIAFAVVAKRGEKFMKLKSARANERLAD